MTDTSKEYFYGATPVITGEETSYSLWEKLQPVSEPVRIFIGHDEIEEVAYHVLTHSILKYASAPVMIMPIELDHLRTLLPRPKDPRQSNSFSFTRFLVPWLCNYEGFAIYMDSDMMLRTDIAKLWWQRDFRRSVQVVKHNYTPKSATKYLGNAQDAYPMKNWSSLMVFNCQKCKNLTPSFVNAASGLELHQFHWADKYEVGELHPDWNWLVGEYDYNPEAKIVHWTNGGPWFSGNEGVEYSGEWYNSYHSMHYARDGSEQLAKG